MLTFDYTLQMIALGAATLGLVSGALGTFAVLRGQSLLGDAVSHAALPGIVLAFLATGAKEPLSLMAGAGVAGWLATHAVAHVTRRSRVKQDTMLALMLAVFFGLGLVLLTYVQRLPEANQAGLESFLFGQAASLVRRDVVTMATAGAVVLVLVAVLWKEFKLLAFDPAFAASTGLPVRRLDALLTTLLVAAIVLGLQTVGVVLMSAMVVAPAAAARQWTDRLETMTLLAAGMGAAAGVAGALLSGTSAGLPTGPMIVLCMGGLVVLSIFFAPNRGLVARWSRQRRNAGRLQMDAVLLDLYALSIQHDRPGHPHTARVLDVMSGAPGRARRALERLESGGLVRRVGERWALTAEGAERAEALLREQDVAH